jgi:hypothetical protein
VGVFTELGSACSIGGGWDVLFTLIILCTVGEAGVVLFTLGELYTGELFTVGT